MVRVHSGLPFLQPDTKTRLENPGATSAPTPIDIPNRVRLFLKSGRHFGRKLRYNCGHSLRFARSTRARGIALKL